MDLQEIIKKQSLEKLFTDGEFGIEKEGLRTNLNKELVDTDHPNVLGSRLYHPYIHTDFSEAQIELVTPVCKSFDETFNWLEALHDVAHRSMDKNEYIWPSSMPNILPQREEDIPLVRYNDPDSIAYREKLAERYGKKKQTISGIHFNFSFSNLFLREIYLSQNKFETEAELRNEIYAKLAGNFLKNEWLLLYLFGASPCVEDDFFNSKSGRHLKKPKKYIRSLRNSSFGYHNDKEVIVRYDTVEEYVKDIKNSVKTNLLFEEREFYGNARLRGKKNDLQDIVENGVQYIEFRSIDINPLDRLGISKKQLKFYHLFMMLMVWMDTKASAVEILDGQKRNLVVADECPFSDTTYKEDGYKLFDKMEDMLVELSLIDEYGDLYQEIRGTLDDPQNTLGARVTKQIKKEGYLDFNQRLGLIYKKYSTDRPYVLNGFSDMELSTQLLIHDAIQKGIKVEILDRSDQFIKLSHKDHVEYVRKGNMTSKDSTISHFIMENKVVTKLVLDEHGYSVPQGGEYNSVEEALKDYLKYKNQGIVIKPKSTNYGIGISVFKKFPSKKSYQTALKIAFKEDKTVLVEEFIEGIEYRFFVLDNKVEAVLLRVPANVTGDGHSTISSLIDEKNQDPLRGENHRAPLAYIGKGSIEKLMLEEQGMTFETIPKKGERVYLRENSNVSTGGDSIDFTDKMHESYKEIAIGIAKTLDVKVTGIDLIIPSYKKASTLSEPGYSCIEANFNPAMNMHAYVTEGKGRRLSKKVLEMLFPELNNYIIR